MKKKTYFLLTASLFVIVAVLHLSRVLFDLPLTIGTYEVAMWVSWVAFFVITLFAYHGFRFRK